MCLCCVTETSGWLVPLSVVYKRLFLRAGGCYLHSDQIHPVCILDGRGKKQRAVSLVIAQIKCINLELSSPQRAILSHISNLPFITSHLSPYHTHFQVPHILLKINSSLPGTLVAFAFQQNNEYHLRHLQV